MQSLERALMLALTLLILVPQSNSQEQENGEAEPKVGVSKDEQTAEIGPDLDSGTEGTTSDIVIPAGPEEQLRPIEMPIRTPDSEKLGDFSIEHGNDDHNGKNSTLMRVRPIEETVETNGYCCTYDGDELTCTECKKEDEV